VTAGQAKGGGGFCPAAGVAHSLFPALPPAAGFCPGLFLTFRSTFKTTPKAVTTEGTATVSAVTPAGVPLSGHGKKQQEP
jgi:hypothetical protein